jgi:hypothetical protein
MVGRADARSRRDPRHLGFCLDTLGRRGRLECLTTFPGVGADVAPRRLVHDELRVIGSR